MLLMRTWPSVRLTIKNEGTETRDFPICIYRPDAFSAEFCVSHSPNRTKPIKIQASVERKLHDSMFRIAGDEKGPVS